MPNPIPLLASLQDLYDEGLPKAAISSIEDTQKIRVLRKVSAYVLGYVGSKIQLPLVPPYDPAIVTCVAQIAAYRLAVVRGFKPDSDADKLVRQQFLDATAWLKDVANGKVRLEQQGSFPESLQPSVDTNQSRGIGDITGNGATDEPIVLGTGNWGG